MPLRGLSRLHQVVPLLGHRHGQKFGLAGLEIGDQSHLVGVIGNDQEIQRSRQLGLLPAGAGDLFALGEAIRIRRQQLGAGGTGIQRQSGVQVGIPEVDARRVISAGCGWRGAAGCSGWLSSALLGFLARASSNKRRRSHSKNHGGSESRQRFRTGGLPF